MKKNQGDGEKFVMINRTKMKNRTNNTTQNIYHRSIQPQIFPVKACEVESHFPQTNK